ncbi:MAG: class I SAM-dependent methyltransferase [bacterium]|nr:class I SAM-dependent methyltransferase [bacterium]
MDQINSDFLNSLDADDKKIFPYLPYILQDLWSLGSLSKYVVGLVKKHITTDQLKHVIDLGCGKGEVLVSLRKEFEFKGLGIDIVPDFIDTGMDKVHSHEFTHDLTLKTGDIKSYLGQLKDKDLVIYAHDSDLLGNVFETLRVFNSNMRSNSWICFESLYSLTTRDSENPDKEEFYDQVNESGLRLIDSIDWRLDDLKEMNDFQVTRIENRVLELVEKHPDKKELFLNYLKNQKEECQELENNLQCVTLLLRKD